MKIFQKDLRHGKVKVGIENLDDLWYLSSVIRPGDLVSAKTERRIKGKDDMERAGKSERVTITITLNVEKADFKLENDTYRITGTIVEGPEDLVSIGTHHTINVEKETMLTIVKDRWGSYELDRLKDAEKSALRPKILIAVIDVGDAEIALVRESKIERYDLSKEIGGKYDTKGRQERKQEFYKDTSDALAAILAKENISGVIIAGAGFEKEYFYKYLAEKRPEIAKIATLENIGSHGEAGVNEVMKRSKAKKLDEEINAAKDIRMLSRVLEELGKESGLAVYGLADADNAASSGAIESLIICDDLFIKNRSRMEPLMQNVKNARGEVHILNHIGDAGKQLSALGGIAGVLRYKIN